MKRYIATRARRDPDRAGMILLRVVSSAMICTAMTGGTFRLTRVSGLISNAIQPAPSMVVPQECADRHRAEGVQAPWQPADPRRAAGVAIAKVFRQEEDCVSAAPAAQGRTGGCRFRVDDSLAMDNCNHGESAAGV